MTGPELKAIRLSLGMTQPAFAKLLGLSGAGSVCRYETGKMRISRPLAILALIAAEFPHTVKQFS